MTERLIVTIMPPETEQKKGKIQDIFALIVDLFDMAGYSESDSEDIVIWRLVSANTRSPLTVVAEAVSASPGVDIADIAQKQKEEFIRNLESLRKGRIPGVWQNRNIRKTVERVVSRSLDVAGPVKIQIDEKNSVAAAEVILENTMLVHEEMVLTPPEGSAKVQMGAIEGTLLVVGTHYNKPAIKLRERKSGNEIWCIIPDKIEAEISGAAQFYDVWHEQRVVLRGQIDYEPTGEIAKIIVAEVRRIESSSVELSDVQDNDFTGGMSVLEYLDKYREGEIG